MKQINLIIGATVLLILFAIGSVAQLQQSGGPGSTVTVGSPLPAGANVIGKFSVDQTTPGVTNAIAFTTIGTTATATGNGVSGLGVQRVAIASDQTAFSVNATIAAALPAGNNVIGSVVTIPKTGCGNTVANVALVAVPTAATLATSAATTCVVVIALNNTTAAPLTVTISDNQGTPVNDLLTFSIPAFSQVIQPLYGLTFTTGVKWTASAAGVTGGMVGFQ